MTPAEQTGEPSTARELSRQLVLLLANVTVITALLVYFGWQRAEVQNRALGLDQALLGMSTQDYLLRSVDQVLTLLAIVGGVGLVFGWADRRLSELVTSSWHGARLVPWAAVAFGVALPSAFVATFAVWSETAYVLWPLSVGVGVLLLLYSSRLRALRRGEDPRMSTLTGLFTLLVLGVCLFTAASHRAEVLGTQLADKFTNELPAQVSVMVTSDKPLYLQGPGVVETLLGEGAFRYSGLKLFDRFDGKVFLLPAGWSPGHGQLIVLAEVDGLRFAYGEAGVG
jgi:hypothetical protein